MTDTAAPLTGLEALNQAVQSSLLLSPAEYGTSLIRQKWGASLDPATAQLVTLDYDYHGHPPIDGVHQGQIRVQQSLVQALLSDYQAVADDRFGETAFGFYTPPAIGPHITLVDHVDEFASQEGGFHRDYEGIYRHTVPQVYGPSTQLPITPAAFKQWVWRLEFKEQYQDYLAKTLPSDDVVNGAAPYALRTSAKTAFVMAAFLQRRELSLSPAGLQLALSAAGLGENQTQFSFINNAQLEHCTHPMAHVEVSRLMIYRYTAQDIWVFRHRTQGRVLLYVPGNSSPLHELADLKALRTWVVAQSNLPEKRVALAGHFTKEDRTDGTFHAGVLTALEAMTEYPNQHRLSRESGFFNNDGYWNPDDYINLDTQPNTVDPFAELVRVFKQTYLQTAEDAIRDDSDVNRANLSAVVEPVVGWLNRWGMLAIFFPGSEGLVALAGLIEAAYGENELENADRAEKRNEGVERMVFGLLNALPLLAMAGAGVAEAERGPRVNVEVPIAEKAEQATGTQTVDLPPPVLADPGIVFWPPGTEGLPLSEWSRAQLMRGFGPAVEGLPAEMLEQIRQVSGVADDHLRVMIANGRQPEGLLADTLVRFKTEAKVQEYLEQLGGSDSPLGTLHLARWLTMDSAWPADVGLQLMDGGNVVWASEHVGQAAEVLNIQQESPFFTALARRLEPSQARALLQGLLKADEPYPNLYTRARLLRQRSEAIAQNKRIELFDSYYQEATKAQGELLQTLAGQYPSLPTPVLEALLSRENLTPASQLSLSEVKGLFTRLEPQVAEYEQGVRLSRAYEGLFLNSVHNADSDTLLLHSIQRMPGWDVQVSVVVREGSLSGPVVDRVGSSALSRQRTLVRVGQRYQAFDEQQQAGYASADFADVVLHSLSKEASSRMGVRVDDLEHFKFKVRRNALQRKALESVLRRQQLRTPFYEPEDVGLIGGSGAPVVEPEVGVRNANRAFAKRMIPGLTDLQADELMGCMEEVDAAQQELQRVSDTSADMERYLQDWTVGSDFEDEYYQWQIAEAGVAEAEAQNRYPDAAERMEEWIDNEVSKRVATIPTLRRLYRWQGEETEKVYRNGRMVGFKLNLDDRNGNFYPVFRPGEAEFPLQPERYLAFNAVVTLSVSTPVHNLDELLISFPRLERLEINGALDTDHVVNIDLPDEEQPSRNLPEQLLLMKRLRHFALHGADLELSPRNTRVLEGLKSLEVLDLSDTSLTTPPSLTGFTQLKTLNLSNTGISVFPGGITEQIPSQALVLSFNQIEAIPAKVTLRAGIDLTGNPIPNPESLRRLLAFRRQTGHELWNRYDAPLLPQPDIWLRGWPDTKITASRAFWDSLIKQSDNRILMERFSGLIKMPEYLLEFEGLRRRIWALLRRISNSQELGTQLVKLSEQQPTLSAGILLETLEQGVLNFDALNQGQPMYQLPKHPRLE